MQRREDRISFLRWAEPFAVVAVEIQTISIVWNPKKIFEKRNEQRLCVCYSDKFFFCCLWNDEAMKKNYNFIFPETEENERKKYFLTLKIQRVCLKIIILHRSFVR